MAYWALVVPGERYADERLYAHDTLRTEAVRPGDAAPGDAVVLVAAGEPPLVFGLGRLDSGGVRYTHRLLDEPRPADGPDLGGLGDGWRRLAPDAFAAIADTIDAAYRVDADKRTWLVSVDLPIEAASAAEAVREFWTYVRELGPAELPAFVAPTDDELAMQAFVLGEEANLDPEEE
jgi:hypothetical protein